MTTPTPIAGGAKLAEVIAAIEAIAPPALAEPWDNVGLIVGDRGQRVTRAMLTIDYTADVAEEARAAGCELIVSYHPPIFEGHKRFTRDGATALAFEAARRGVAIYSPHTALDVADGGTNDVLADAVAMTNRRPLRPRDGGAQAHHKLAVYVPRASADAVAEAMFAAGAGGVGRYARCSFRVDGVGTFQGDATTSPAVGTPGAFTRVDETRVEMLAPIANLDDIIAAMKAAHPYEEVAFDLLPLAASPPTPGIGRVGRLPGAITLEMVANLLRRSIGVERLLIAGDGEAMISTVAVCAGAGGSLLKDAIAARVDLYVTGEMRHHDALAARRAGVSVICTLHSNSERATLAVLARRLGERVPNVSFAVSVADRDPFRIA